MLNIDCDVCTCFSETQGQIKLFIRVTGVLETPPYLYQLISNQLSEPSLRVAAVAKKVVKRKNPNLHLLLLK